MLLENYKFTTGGERELFRPDPNPISWLSAISIMLCMMTGNDANFFDQIFIYGVVNVACMCVLAAILNIVASYLFISTWRYNYGNQYAEIVKDTFGGGHQIVRIIYIITLLYSGITNISSIKNTLHMIAVPRLGQDSILANNYFIFYFLVTVCTVPFVFVHRFASLRWYFIWGNIAVLILLSTTIYNFVKSYKEDGFDPSGKFKLTTNSFWGLVQAFSFFTTLFWGQPFICNVATTLKKTTQSYVFNIVYSSTFFVAIVNFSIGLFSHFILWGETDDDFLYWLDQKSPITLVAQICSLINLLITNAGYLIIASKQIIQLFSQDVNRLCTFFGIIMVLFVCAAIDHFYTNGYDHIIELIGSITYSIMALILPPMLYLKAFKVKGVVGWVAVIHLIVCLTITGLIIRVYFLK